MTSPGFSTLVVGAGLIGARRARVAAAHPRTKLAGVCDVVPERAEALARAHGGEAFADWREALARAQPDLVVVATTNRMLAPIAVEALARGAHVLIEKPMGRNAGEARAMAAAARQHGRVLKVGFNHRNHPAVRKACEAARAGRFGPILFVRSIYGHGGRPGYEHEWRGSREECGGGELLDQGVHVLDLLQWLLGPPAHVRLEAADFVWPIRPLEDNAFALLRYPGGQVAQLHTSWTQWKNRFTFEIYCREGSFEVNGLGGSYGVETLTIARRRLEGGAPDLWTETFPGPDRSWDDEWHDFVTAIETGTLPMSHADESLAVMETVAALYR